MPDIAFASAHELAAKIRAKEIGARELLEHYLRRVEKYNPALNAIIATDYQAARSAADAADTALAKGEVSGPLHGVPMTFKESYDAERMPTTWGLEHLADNIPEVDSVPVARMKAAGAVVFGKTNVPVMLADWQSFNPVYGSTNNPWDLDRTPGGSSGGSAAALAAGLTGLEAGSDIGASIRNPAHYCGVYGHKPTWGILPPRGHALPGTITPADISVIGPLARSAEDLDISLDIMAGPHGLDAACWTLNLPQATQREPGDFKVAVVLEDQNVDQDTVLTDALQKAIDTLAGKGMKIVSGAKPAFDTKEAHSVYVRLLRAATSGRVNDEEMAKQHALLADLGDDDDSYIAEMARGNTMLHRDWLKLNNRRNQMRETWQELFEEVDLLLCPIASTTAFPHDQEGERIHRKIVVNNKKEPVTDQLFWAGYTGAFYLPSTVAPVGLASDGLPVGLQIVAPHGHDKRAIAFAKMMERELGGFIAPKGYE